MKLKTLLITTFLGLSSIASAQVQENQNMQLPKDAMYLTGDTKLACEAVLCLSSGTRPAACSPSIKRYFSIHHRKLSDTIKARKNFLHLCPASSMQPQMLSLVNAISNAEGRCTADALNSSLRTQDVQYYDLKPLRSIKSGMPGYCIAIQQHEYTDYSSTTLPRYVGEVDLGGYWVEARNFDAETQRYNVWKEQYLIEVEKARQRWIKLGSGR